MTFDEPVIYLDYDPFARESRICILKDGSHDYRHVASELDEAAKEIMALAYENDIYVVKSHAPYATSSELRRQIEDIEKQTYSMNKIKVEGV